MPFDQVVGQVAQVPAAAGAGEVGIERPAAAGAEPADAAVQLGREGGSGDCGAAWSWP